MAHRKANRFERALQEFAHRATRWSGSSWAFLLAVIIVLVWAVTGPLFDFADTWQLVSNTGTTIVTFLMVFLIQRSQNKDTLALHLKLNEIVAALKGASNRLIDVEDLPEEEIHRLHERYQHLAKQLQTARERKRAHSVEEERPREAAPGPEKGLTRTS